jgi:hypothetical protein
LGELSDFFDRFLRSKTYSSNKMAPNSVPFDKHATSELTFVRQFGQSAQQFPTASKWSLHQAGQAAEQLMSDAEKVRWSTFRTAATIKLDVFTKTKRWPTKRSPTEGFF